MIQRYHFIIFIVGCDHNFSLYFSASSTRLNSSNNTNYIHHPLTSRHDSYTFYTIKNNTNLVTKKKTHLAEKSSLINNDITKISQRIVEKLETASSKDLSDAKYAKKILQLSDLHHTKQLFQEIKDVSPGIEQVIEKRAVIKALLLSTWLQRLYFIIRTAIMSLLGGNLLHSFTYPFFGQIGVVLAIVMGMITFTVGLMVTRLFDTQIVEVTKYIVRLLSNHKKIRDFIMNRFQVECRREAFNSSS